MPAFTRGSADAELSDQYKLRHARLTPKPWKWMGIGRTKITHLPLVSADRKGGIRGLMVNGRPLTHATILISASLLCIGLVRFGEVKRTLWEAHGRRTNLTGRILFVSASVS